MQGIISILQNEQYQVPISIVKTLIVALIMIAAGNFIIKKVLNPERSKVQKFLSENDQRRAITLNRMIKSVWKALVITMAIINILSLFVDVKAILTVAGVGTIAIGIGAKAIVEDMLSGFVILFENQFCVGDYIEINGGHYGCVEEIGLRTTRIRQLDHSLYIVHNGQITDLTNYSKGTVRAIVTFGVAFEASMEKIRPILETLFETLQRDQSELYVGKPVIMGVEDLGDSAVIIRVEADVRAENRRKAERDLRLQIKQALDANCIEIPYNKFVLINGTSEEDEG